ncbi:hypothetical protein OBCHQ24_13415 [Oceanobacillus iheyensis]|uniref:CHY-type domain-containing protein n=1 Tax=Oceanobacillus jordanicus TaxID=2867266 RepID=A0AAW5B9Q9_9BACI|nr:CHY zinc finger protein [Oceanobacillus jordanicus]AVQ99966.1 hypothetical protein OBCHQ24_13415 [Oceanobacillus iheyensis]MCG3420258.1 hypothetical protein [Oceanobacillus jordanicus]
MNIHEFTIKGSLDKETRCTHYHGPTDRIAIKFYCCQEYYPCYKCHEEYGCGKEEVWPKEKFDHKAILCGSCGKELSIGDYLKSGYACHSCQAAFNPGCALHYELYFEK